LGSVLEVDGKVLWGDRGSFGHFADLTLPIDGGTGPPVVATSLIKQIGIFGPLKIHQYDGIFDVLVRDIGYVEGRDLFPFPYDWRRSSFDNAALLAAFVEKTPALHGEFDIIAHSMGGLIARIYVQQTDKGKRVRTVLNLAVPFQGSMSALYTMDNGWGFPANTLAGGLDAIHAAAMSFPSLYELLPRYGECCINGVPGKGDPISILSPEFWAHYAILPAQYHTAAGQAFIATQLGRARELAAIVEQDLPTGVHERTVVGDLQATRSRVYIDPARGTLGPWQEERGDGTVVLLSAANRHLAQTDPAFTSHQIIFDDDHVKLILQRMFDADAGQLQKYAGAPVPEIVRPGREALDVESVKIDLPAVLPAGQATAAEITVHTRQAVAPGDIHLAVTLGDGLGAPTPVLASETTTTDTGQVAKFNLTMQVPNKAGYYELTVAIPGIGRFAENTMVIMQ